MISDTTTAGGLDLVEPQDLQVRKIIAIASGKGGVGKTWLAITLSHALAKRGRKVLLFDGDIGLANVDIQLGLMPNRDLGSVLAQGNRLMDAAMPVGVTGFDVVAGKSGSGSLDTLARHAVIRLRQDLIDTAAYYDNVVVDIGAGIDATQLVLASSGGPLLIVTNDEPTSLTDAYAFIKVASRLVPRPELQVVVNGATSRADGERTYATLKRACEGFLRLEVPLAGVIRRDTKVREAIRHQVPLLTRFPTAAAAVDVLALAEHLAQEG
jgi:flagellar biosynthesis protein FlhG